MPRRPDVFIRSTLFVAALLSVATLSSLARADDSAQSPDSPDYGKSKSELHKDVEPEQPRTHVVAVKPITSGAAPTTSSSVDSGNAPSMGFGIQFDLSRPRDEQPAREPKKSSDDSSQSDDSD